jgi:DNA polymerase-3 subunit gamma/tau
MTTQNTIDHLKYVAEKEGYTAEPEALALIAEKADGGMRDALSIFDQMVSFSGGNLTYENVCQNLNVLSQEYYFQLVDHFLANRVPECLLLLNDVLLKGFDGGNFIAGLATHLRNLLVSRDAVTLPLLEMSEKMRSRYQEQALRTPIRFIYKALKLANDCDQAYRTSRNKRLQVEICLIQCAAPSSDPSPEEVKTPPVASATPKPQPAPKAQTPQSVQSSQSIQKNPSPQTSLPPSSAEGQEEAPRKLPKVSFKHFGAGKKEEEASAVPEQKKDEPVEHPVEPINEAKLTAAWFSYIGTLPHESVALAGRLKGLQPVVENDNTALLKVSNQQVQQTVESLKPQMLATMRQELRNFDFNLDIQLEEIQEVVKSYSPSEVLKMMQEQNPDVGDLVSKLQLKFA